MTDRDEALMQTGNDLELITSYLNGHLDPERLQQVRRRLDDDPAFRDLAAPMLLTWSVPTHLQRHPRPAGELEKHWDDFTKRAGFAHRRRIARRRRWLTLGAILLTLGASYLTLHRTVAEWYHDRRDFHPVPTSTVWAEFAEGRDVQTLPGALMRVANKPDTDDVLAVRLSGTARFRTRVVDSNVVAPELHMTSVQTRAGATVFGYGEITVTAVGDTTIVESHHPALRQSIALMPLPTIVLVSGIHDRNPLRINEGQRARVVRGKNPELLP